MIRDALRVYVMALALAGPATNVWSAAATDPLDFSGSSSDVPRPPVTKSEPPPPPAPPASPRREPCEAAVSEANGVVTLSLEDPARADTTTSITLDARSYAVRFDGAGNLVARAPMFSAKADLGWIGLDGRACDRRGIAFATFQTIVLTALVWSGPYDLALHVVEPSGGRFGGSKNYISPARPNPDHAYGLGDLQSFGLPRQSFGVFGQGGNQAQLYTLAAPRNPGHGDIYYFVEFVSRGNPARPPLCGTDGKLTVPYKIIHIDADKPEQKGGSFGPLACGTSWSEDPNENANFQRWKFPLRERH